MYNRLYKSIKANKDIIFCIISFLTILLVIILRQWEVVGRPFLFAEDGYVFINRARAGTISALLTPYAGYYLFIPQFITFVFYTICKFFDDVTKLPYMMWASSVLIAASAVSYFMSERFAWVLEKRRDRLIVCCLTVLLIPAEINTVWGNITYIHWWLGLLSFYIGLNLYHERQMPSALMVIILVICGFSTLMFIPLCLLFTLFIAIKAVKKELNKRDIVKYLAILIPNVIQIITVLGSYRTSRFISMTDVPGIIPSFLNYVGKLITPESWIFYNSRMILLGIITVCIIGYTLREKKQLVYFTYLYSVGFLFYCAVATGVDLASPVKIGHYSFYTRQWFVTLATMAWLLSVALVKVLASKAIKPIPLAASILIAFTVVSRFDIKTPLHHLDYTVYYEQYAQLYSNTGVHRLRIPLNAYRWHVTLPINDLKNTMSITGAMLGIDYIDDQSPFEHDIVVTNDWVRISGWMYDSERLSAFEYVLIAIDNRYYPMLKTSGHDVPEYYQLPLPHIGNYRFSGAIPKSALQTGENTLNIIGVHSYGVASEYVIFSAIVD